MEKFKPNQLVRGKNSGSIYRIISIHGNNLRLKLVEPRGIIRQIPIGTECFLSEYGFDAIRNGKSHPLTQIFQ